MVMSEPEDNDQVGANGPDLNQASAEEILRASYGEIFESSYEQEVARQEVARQEAIERLRDSGQRYYDRQGTVIDLLEWARLFGDYSYKRVARTTITSAADPGNTFNVSTVWMGIDSGFGHGPPVIFETMVFSSSQELEHDCQRYPTEEQALRGHDEVVTVVAATMDDPVIINVDEEE